jgi:hypothetical protein
MLEYKLSPFGFQSLITFDNLPDALLVSIASAELLRQFLQVTQEVLVDPVLADLCFQAVELLRAAFEDCLLLADLFQALFVASTDVFGLLPIALDLAVIAVDLLLLGVEIACG